MPIPTNLDVEICELKKLLVHLVEQSQFNFLDPRVLALSQRLDILILQEMKQQRTGLT
ncbi:aspartyl-phosphate phosphatase Spo0E family protein [Paenibacillus sp. YN15]|uniref:aspartyl-phosphate phosphatase Spo0E family protein n=1 Tax=Paenibacillus sp. YN15 TaxID=1742774 RepID=UPI0015EBC8E0|nr:aspartyl-phosphate phosphatase Spo0E family protein [Paenibacillus sp. YN15]